jgi:16S rRNA C967 or C1407 C5-methylase (RsmB/RsmF family)
MLACSGRQGRPHSRARGRGIDRNRTRHRAYGSAPADAGTTSTLRAVDVWRRRRTVDLVGRRAVSAHTVRRSLHRIGYRAPPPRHQMAAPRGGHSTLALQQRRLLHALWHTLTAGGKLLYATCSVFPAENQLQISAFLQSHPRHTAAAVWHPRGPQEREHCGPDPPRPSARWLLLRPSAKA